MRLEVLGPVSHIRPIQPEPPPRSTTLEYTEDELQELLGYFLMKLKGQTILPTRPVEGMSLILGGTCGIISFSAEHGEGKMLAIGSELNRRAPTGSYDKPTESPHG